MAFEMNYSDLSQTELIPEGEYECVIENAMETATDRGTPFLSIRCRVRRDVRQEQQGRVIFHDLWMKRNPEPQDAAFDGYSAKQILALSRAAGLAAGTRFDGLSDWCDALTGRAVRLTVYHDTYNGRTNARVRWVNETRFPEGDGSAQGQSAGNNAPPHQSPAAIASPQRGSHERRAPAQTAAAPAAGFQPIQDDDEDLPF